MCTTLIQTKDSVLGFTGERTIMDTKKNGNIIEQCRLLLEKSNDFPKLTVYGAYGVAITGLCVIIYRSKNLAKFTKPLDIPTKFIKESVPLHGVVKHIEPSSGTLLMVDHKPVISLPLLQRQKCLPVKLAGIDLTSNGISWLQAVVRGKEVTFIPLGREKEYVNCIVSMSQENKQEMNIGEEITRLGFATVSSSPLERRKSKLVSAYHKSLHTAEKQAKHKRNGQWQFLIPPSLLGKLQQMLFQSIPTMFVAK